jgi:hypothetical protein
MTAATAGSGNGATFGGALTVAIDILVKLQTGFRGR